jgi:lariat debranching enzyme
MWYTNPQTEALCAMIQIENKINPVPADAKKVTSSGETPISNSDKGSPEPSLASK